MGKTTKALALTAGIAGAAGFAALTATPDQVSASTGTVTYQEGATTVWQTPAFNQVKRYVLYNQQIEILGQKTVNGTVWYQIGANEWIPEIYLQVAGTPAATASATPVTQAAAASASSQAGNFNLTVTYQGGATTVWTGTSYSAPTGRYLTTGQTVSAVAKTVSGGETWYKLSNGGYVPARFARETGAAVATTPAATTTPVATPAQTPAATTPAPAVTAPAESAAPQTPSTPAQTPAATPTTNTPAQSTPSTTTPVASTPAVTSGSYSLTITNPGNVVTVWTTPAYSKANGTYLANGAQVTANGSVVVADETWYQLTTGGFVPAQFAKTGTTSTPAPAPSTSTSNSGATTGTTTTPTPAPSTSTPAPAPSTSTSTDRAAKVQAVINLAMSLRGTPYVFGSSSLSGFDCSGFVKYVMAHAAGLDLLRTSAQQATQGTRIATSQAQPGDLYFWANSTGVYHVGIALGNGQYIAAPKPGDVVKTGSTQYFQPSFATRVL
ncbi:C40 family peptidase [Lacticaseibacillus daqingensis]|uniref:C40 family peptidase n=1 Tax=Lacticaseibacillus daqingensis TaxID=2486014 RepID=UPI0013DDDFD6|nr:C40 family peptidase [Lacticaseibacillus daqingensis]